jgi:hypothetical protein
MSLWSFQIIMDTILFYDLVSDRIWPNMSTETKNVFQWESIVYRIDPKISIMLYFSYLRIANLQSFLRKLKHFFLLARSKLGKSSQKKFRKFQNLKTDSFLRTVFTPSLALWTVSNFDCNRKWSPDSTEFLKFYWLNLNSHFLTFK